MEIVENHVSTAHSVSALQPSI